MTETEFWHKQFKLKGIPQGNGSLQTFELCKRVIQMDGKLSSRRYNELLRIAREYCEV